MTYQLYIGDRRFSSWSMRGWLMFSAFGIPFKPKMVGLYTGTMADDLAPLAPARLVPVLNTPQGAVIQDTIAMAETLVEAHPDVPLLPADPVLRGTARWLIAEMHSGFGALREACPMNLGQAWTGFSVSDAVQADLARIETLWAHAWAQSGSDGWLFGEYSLADVFYAPVAARIAGYGLPVSERAQAYVDMHLHHHPFRQWRSMGMIAEYDPMPYDQGLDFTSWPGPARLVATPVATGPSENATCPYSGDPVTDFLKIDGRVFGFCNPFCRDKTLDDPGAWPAFMKIYQS